MATKRCVVRTGKHTKISTLLIQKLYDNELTSKLAGFRIKTKRLLRNSQSSKALILSKLLYFFFKRKQIDNNLCSWGIDLNKRGPGSKSIIYLLSLAPCLQVEKGRNKHSSIAASFFIRKWKHKLKSKIVLILWPSSYKIFKSLPTCELYWIPPVLWCPSLRSSVLEKDWDWFRRGHCQHIY